MSLEAVIKAAEGELGNTEYPPGSNRVKYWDDYGPGCQGQPWCVAFLWWCFRQAGESAAFFGGAKTASCGTLLRWYEARGQTVPAEDVQAGDIVILNFSGTRDTQHCGIVESKGNGCIVAIEGNTTNGSGSQASGGEVCRKTRYTTQIVGVCRPKYAPELPLTDKPEDFAGHWAESDIRWCMDRGLLKGYEDGAFRPDRAVTRAELAAVLRRLDGKGDLCRTGCT